VKVGVIGVGSMGQNHARVYSEIAELSAVCDENKAQAEAIAHRFSTAAYSGYRELLKDESISAVSIATPTATHFEIAKDAFDAGKHVLLEKPICSTQSQAQELIDISRSLGLTFAVGLIERHNPVVQLAKSLIDKKEFGDVITMASRRVSSNPARVQDAGVIMDMGTHDIDIMRYFAGSGVDTVYAVHSGRERETFANILLSFHNGICAMVEVNWLTPMKVRKASLTCSEKFVEVDYMNQTLQISSSQQIDHSPENLFQVPHEYDVRQVSLRKQEPLRKELQDFIEAIEKKRKPLVTGEDGLDTLRIVQAAMESGKTRKPVSMA
jgi:UDP-N-acetylglucosamine 3-dehydrogenase